MSAHHGNRHTEDTHHAQIHKAALIANFYGKRGQLSGLIDRLAQQLDLIQQSQNSYIHEIDKHVLYYFDSPVASDTTILQLALNATEAVEPAWHRMRAQLTAIFPDDASLEGLWGYTLIYQAELTRSTLPASILQQTLPAARGLLSSSPEQTHLLAETELPGGWIGLVTLPLEGDGLQAATVYLAFSWPDPHNRLVREVLYKPTAAWLMADLIAHKGYFQIRQYRVGDVIDQYRQQMDALRNHASDMLMNLSETTAGSKELETLGQKYRALIVATNLLHTLQIGLTRQLDNYAWWYKQAGEGEILRYHQHLLEVATRELDLLIQESQRPFESATMAVDLMRTKLEKQQEQKQQQIETLLAAGASVLSVLALVDKDGVRGVLEALSVPQPISIFLVLGIQVGLIVLVALLVALVMHLIRTKRSG